MSQVEGWEVVFTGPRYAAEVVAAALEAHGHRAEVMGDNAYGLLLDLTESRVFVPIDEAEAAQKMIAGEFGPES